MQFHCTKKQKCATLLLFSLPHVLPFLCFCNMTWQAVSLCWGLGNGNEMHGGTVSKSSRLSISLNHAGNVFRCFFFSLSFKLAQNIGFRAKGAKRGLLWTPALLTPHDVFGCDCMNYLRCYMAFNVRWLCCLCACGPGEHENGEQKARFSCL